MSRPFSLFLGLLGALTCGMALVGAHWQSSVHLSTAGQVAAGLFAALGFALMMAAYAGNRSFNVLVVEGITLLVMGFCYHTLLTATGRSPQKRTLADIRGIATAIEARQTDTNDFPPARNLDELARYLEPTYIRHIPRVDGFRHEFRYEAWKEDPKSPGLDHYSIASAGHDWKFEKSSARQYRAGETTNFDCDVVYRDGGFVSFPEGIQEGTEYAWKDPKTLFDEATSLYKADRYSEAIPLFERYLRIHPDDALANARFGMSLGQVGKLQQSIPYLQKAIAGDPTDYQSPSNLGLVHEKLGKPEDGIEWERKADAIKPNDAAVLNNLGWVLMRSGHNAEAVTVFQRAVRLAPNEKLYRENLAQARKNAAVHPPS
jgi:tetratricopeptide (TPR) repeat protein